MISYKQALFIGCILLNLNTGVAMQPPYTAQAINLKFANITDLEDAVTIVRKIEQRNGIDAAVNAANQYLPDFIQDANSDDRESMIDELRAIHPIRFNQVIN